MATPTQAPTKVPQEPDPFYYDYDTVQTVGMTLATILFLLGILIIISKKVKCRKADSSPTCKSCKSELPSSVELHLSNSATGDFKKIRKGNLSLIKFL
ncbi:FXYD domain-containing ion transport regulator 7 isoform X6 [Manis javanica]|uniref:FXYD domain-containing ion transport regulator 7 isoform X6 n=1 Tax=Manis javanica TaxID=9974 RepID=UPI00187A2440|nr:FXYD domain-containing ion transport regulator 7 isoform X2 [Manis javanica]